jgi:hypothetical protein
MNTIVLNQSNILTGSNNSTLVYNFPSSVRFDNHQIAVQSVNMYYSWQNINSTSLKNNSFSYTWVVGSTTTTYTVTIPAGLYEIEDINNYLQFVFIQAGQYLINTTGQYVYYAEFIVNPNTYAVNIITYPVPLSLPSGWTAPVANPQTGAVAFVGYPTTYFNPLITIPANFSLIVGYATNFATSQNTGNNTILTYTSSIAPQVQPNPTALMTISNISNEYSSPSSIIHSVVPDVGFGELIKSVPNEYVFCKLLKGTISSLFIRFVGQDANSLAIQDPNMSIILLIRETPMSER